MQEQRALGNILIRHGVVAEGSLEPYYALQREKATPLFELLVTAKAATQSDLARALAAECRLPFGYYRVRGGKEGISNLYVWDGQQGFLDVLVAGAFLEEDDHFAARTLPGIAGLYPPGPVAKGGFASRAADLN